jgi:hypothetical protein
MRRLILMGTFSQVNGIPSHDCIRRILLILKLEAFQRCSEKCIGSGFINPYNSASNDSVLTGQITIDGKTLRRSDQASGLCPLHLVSAWR